MRPICELATTEEGREACPYKGKDADGIEPLCCYPYLPGFHDPEDNFPIISESEMSFMDCPLTRDLPSWIFTAISDHLDRGIH